MLRLPNRFVFGETTHTEVELRKLKAKDHDWLQDPSTQRDGNVVARLVCRLIERLDTVTDQTEIWHRMQGMLAADLSWLVLEMRKRTYGDIAPLRLTCRRCRKESNQDVDLSTFTTEVLDVPPPAVSSFSFVDDGDAYTGKYRPLLVKDMSLLETIGKSEKVTKTALVQLLELNGSTPTAAMIGDMSSPALDQLISELGKGVGGVDSRVDWTCPHCELEQVSVMPIGPDFLFKRTEPSKWTAKPFRGSGL